MAFAPRRSWLVPALVMLLGAGCSSIRVYTDWDTDIPLTSFRQYAWEEPPEIEGANPFADNTLLRKRLRRAIEATLAERGFKMVESLDEADFLVTYSVLLEQQLRVSGGASLGVGAWSRRGVAGGVGYSSGSIRSFQESTLVIDLLDPENRDLVWRGWANGVVRTRDRNRNEARLNKGVRRILSRFPPEPTKG